MEKRKRTKNYAVSVSHEDYMAMNRRVVGLQPQEVEAGAVLHAALRRAHSVFGGHRVLDVVAQSLPRQYVINWSRKFLSSCGEERRAA